MKLSKNDFCKLADAAIATEDLIDNFTKCLDVSIDGGPLTDISNSIVEVLNNFAGYVADQDFDPEFGSPIDIFIYNYYFVDVENVFFKNIAFSMEQHDDSFFVFSKGDREFAVSNPSELYNFLCEIDKMAW